MRRVSFAVLKEPNAYAPRQLASWRVVHYGNHFLKGYQLMIAMRRYVYLRMEGVLFWLDMYVIPNGLLADSKKAERVGNACVLGFLCLGVICLWSMSSTGTCRRKHTPAWANVRGITATDPHWSTQATTGDTNCRNTTSGITRTVRTSGICYLTDNSNCLIWPSR